MKESEIYTKALKQNLDDPTDLSSSEVLKAKRKYGYVKTNYAKYIAAAAAAAIAVGAAVVYALKRPDTVPEPASDITVSRPDETPAADSVPDTQPDQSREAADISLAEPEDKLEIYRQVVKAVSAAPEKYYSTAFYYGEGESRVKTVNSYWIRENDIAAGAEDNTASKVAGYLENAESVEYLGYFFGFENRTVPDYVTDIFSRIEASQLTVEPLSFFNKCSERLNIVEDGGAVYLSVTYDSDYTFNKEEVIAKYYYYKVTSAAEIPCYDGERFDLENWATCASDNSYVLDADELMSMQNDRSFSVFDPENRIGFTYTLDFTGETPVVNITDITAPEGLTFSDAKFTVMLDSDDDYARSPVVKRTAEFKTGPIDFEAFKLDFSKEDIRSLRVQAEFNTNEHSYSADQYDPDLTAYFIRSYCGIDREYKGATEN